MNPLAIAAVVVAGLVPGLGSCAGPDQGALRELEQAKARWTQSGVHSYEMTLAFGCFCREEVTAPVVVTVQDDDEVVSVRWAEPDAPDGEPDPDRPTVDRLFQIAEDAIENADATLVEFDPALGYPTEIRIDPDPDVTDDEGAYRVEGLSPIG